MLLFNFNPIFKARGIERPYTFLVKAGIPPRSATNFMNNNFSGFKLSHVELICKALFCQPNDLLQWIPDKDEILPDNHPLQKLKQEETYDSWQKTLATMPLEQLKELAKAIEIKK